MTETFLMADLGGTNVRFAVFDGKQTSCYKSYRCQDFDTFFDVLSEYKKDVSLPKNFVLAVPGVIKEGELSFVNNSWRFSTEQIKSQFDFQNIIVMNDFQAVALGLSVLSGKDISIIKTGEKEKTFPSIIIGAGTGLGVGVLLPSKYKEACSLASEAGHIAISVTNETEEKIYTFIRQNFGRVSAGHVISGAGIQNIYKALGGENLSSEDIVSLAIGGDDLAKKTILQMFSFWGDVSGDLALAFVAKGGVYLSGNIIQVKGMFDLLMCSDFIFRFESKAGHSNLMKSIPIFQVLRPDIAFEGLKKATENLLF